MIKKWKTYKNSSAVQRRKLKFQSYYRQLYSGPRAASHHTMPEWMFLLFMKNEVVVQILRLLVQMQQQYYLAHFY